MDGRTDSRDEASSPFSKCTANAPTTVVTNCHKEMENLLAGYVIKTFVKEGLKQHQHIKYRSKGNATSLVYCPRKYFKTPVKENSFFFTRSFACLVQSLEMFMQHLQTVILTTYNVMRALMFS